MCDKNDPNNTGDESTDVYNFIPDDVRDRLKSIDLDEE